MSFLDHLEELRVRIFKAIAAIMVGVIAGWFLVERFHLVAVLKAPIAPYLPAGKLVVLSPTEPLMIVLKLAVILGCILASPVVIWQVWGFLSPALYVRERKIVVPALTVGVGLFLLGAVLAFVFVVPQVLTVLFSFQTESLATMITFEKYFDFVVQLMVAMGISFELPLVIMILASFGLVTPAALSRFRRVAIILSLVAGAVLSPGTDVFSMLMLSIPLILLYEVGYVGSIVIWRRKTRTVAAGLVLLSLAFGGVGRMEAQVTPPPTTVPALPRIPTTPPRRPGDTLGIQRGAPVDTAAARRMGLPTGPSREFPPSDSVLDALLRRDGYESTRFQADSATLYVPERRIDLEGRAMTDRAGSILEARRIGYAESSCVLDARGDPKVFDQGTVLVGEGLRYNTCEKRAVVSEALTNFQENGVGWFMRGDLAQDSTARRIYASSADITSCDLPVPHYHFAARQAKWISKSVLVARPAVLYVRDVPLLWLPFIFQDGRPGRRSGILVPKFGINDIVRLSKNYSRQVTNVGYYWAPNDYFDALAKFDWYASRYYRWEVGVQYHWLDRFVGGSFLLNRTVDDRGASALGVIWSHRQSFSLTSALNLNVNYTSNTSIDRRNSTNPSTVIQQVTSGASYQKRFAWGMLNIGANRSQSLTNGSITEVIPTVSFSPNPIDLGTNITWSPGFSFSQGRSRHSPAAAVLLLNPNDSVDTSIPTTSNSRTTSFALNTPFRIGGFNWTNSLAVTDAQNDQRGTDSYKIPDTSTLDPNDSVAVTRITDGDFSTGIDWSTGITLPSLFRGSWKVTPRFQVSNVAGTPFLIRNRRTGGQFVAQSKRPEIGLSSNPTFFAFLPGFGPIARIRHSFLPTLSFSYVPEATIPDAYARATARPGQLIKLTVPASQTATLGFSQSFEAKAQRGPADTGAISTARKYKLLSIATSSVSYDFERAKQLHQTGWITDNLSNTFESDLVPGFNVALTHDLWRGPVGTDSARFEPFLSGVSAGFGVSGNTFRSLGHLLGLGKDSVSSGRTAARDPAADAGLSARERPGSFSIDRSLDRKGHTPFQARVTYSLTRQRPDSVARRAQASLGLNTSFAPTPFWSVTWSTQYNIAQGHFESQLITLERDLHEWRATFNFQRSPNGNFAFVFNIALLDLPAVKFDYNQTTLTR